MVNVYLYVNLVYIVIKLVKVVILIVFNVMVDQILNVLNVSMDFI